MTAKDFEDACQQSVRIGTMVSMLAMYAWFLKVDRMFNPHRLLADQRTTQFVKRITNKQDKHRHIKKRFFIGNT